MTNLSITRELATEILEAIAEKLGNESIFDNKYANDKAEPDGSWYEYEDLVTEKLDGLVDSIRYRVVNCIDETQKEKK
jgi:hypothetical protein